MVADALTDKWREVEWVDQWVGVDTIRDAAFTFTELIDPQVRLTQRNVPMPFLS